MASTWYERCREHAELLLCARKKKSKTISANFSTGAQAPLALA